MTPPTSSPRLNADQREAIDAYRIARFATVDEDRRPHIVPICFCVVGDNIYTPIDEKPKRGAPAGLRRLRNIEANPNVQVLFDIYDDHDWSNLRYLQLRGVASIVDEAAERRLAITTLRARYAQYEHMSLEDRPIIRVSIERVVEWSASG